jgi:streptogramin lyase
LHAPKPRQQAGCLQLGNQTGKPWVGEEAVKNLFGFHGGGVYGVNLYER